MQMDCLRFQLSTGPVRIPVKRSVKINSLDTLTEQTIAGGAKILPGISSERKLCEKLVPGSSCMHLNRFSAEPSGLAQLKYRVHDLPP